MTQRITLLPWLPLLALAGLPLALGGCAPAKDAAPGSNGAASGTEQVIALAGASEAVVGEGRFPFGLLDLDGEFIEDAQVRVRFYKLGQDGAEELKSEAEATFRQVQGVTPHQHADGELHLHQEVRGVYVVDKATFDEPGIWRARFEATATGSPTPQLGSLAFQVEERSATMMVGDAVPPSHNPTARDVQELSQITTHTPPVPGLYQLTVEEAIGQHQPFVVLFATPAFCLSRMCGPVTDVVAQLYESYGDRVNFIHIEPWKLEVARTEGRLELSDVALEWGLPSEPWLFVVDAQGRVSARFEGLVSAEELAAALEGVLQ